MSGLNKAQIIGRLGRDPEIRYSQQGTAVTTFSVATSEQWKDKNSGEQQEKTEWHRVCSFGKQAEILEKYLKKGSQVYIEGKLQTRSYEKDGQTHYTTEIVVKDFQFLGGMDQGQSNQQPAQSQSNQNQQSAQSQPQFQQQDDSDPNIPF